MPRSRRRDFNRMATSARREGLVGAGRPRLRDLERYVRDTHHVKDPRERQYVVERICLAPHPSVNPVDQMVEYVAAVGETVGATSGDRKKALRSMIEDIKKASRQAPDTKDVLLYQLLHEDHQHIAPAAGALARDGSVVTLPSEGTLFVVGDLHGDASTATRLCDFLDQEISAACGLSLIHI